MPGNAALSKLREIALDLDSAMPTQAHLDTLGRAVGTAVGFATVTLAVLRATGEYEVISEVTGDQTNRYGTVGTHVPVELADHLRSLTSLDHPSTYLSRDMLIPDGYAPHFVYADHSATTTASAADEEEHWHPHDAFGAVVHSPESGRAIWVQFEDPVDGRRPTPRALSALEDLLVPLCALVLGIDRDLRLRRAVDLAGGARAVVRVELAKREPTAVLAATADQMRALLGADLAWVDSADHAGPFISHPLPRWLEDHDDLRSLGPEAHAASRNLWQQGRAMVISPTRTIPPDLDSVVRDLVLGQISAIGMHTAMLIPFGWQSTWKGTAVLLRSESEATWTDLEIRAAATLGHDIGAAVHAAEMFVHEATVARSKARLIDTMVHELKTPLTAVQGYLELLEDDPDLPEPARVALSRLEEASRRVESMTGDLLFLARSRNPDAEPAPQTPLDLNGAVRGVVHDRAAQALSTQRRLLTELPEQPTYVGVNRTVARRIVDSLVSNSLKFSDPGSTVTVRVEPGVGSVLLVVNDDGWGISEADQVGLFTEFHRGSDPRVRALPGAGLSLAIVARLAVNAGGGIRVESAVGRGTRVDVSLPAAP